MNFWCLCFTKIPINSKQVGKSRHCRGKKKRNSAADRPAVEGGRMASFPVTMPDFCSCLFLMLLHHGLFCFLCFNTCYPKQKPLVSVLAITQAKKLQTEVAEIRAAMKACGRPNQYLSRTHEAPLTHLGSFRFFRHFFIWLSLFAFFFIPSLENPL